MGVGLGKGDFIVLDAEFINCILCVELVLLYEC